jgi:hypothetical protein
MLKKIVEVERESTRVNEPPLFEPLQGPVKKRSSLDMLREAADFFFLFVRYGSF